MHANHPLSLLIVVFVAFLSSASSLTLAAENNNHAFTGDTASCGHGGRLGPRKNASPERLNEPDLRDPMKYTAVAVRSSAMNCNAELNSSDHNTVCVRVAMPPKKNNAFASVDTGRPTKNAPTLSLPSLMVELDPLEPMKWTDATKPPSLSTNFETNSSGRNTVCDRVVMMKKKNNVCPCTCIGTTKTKTMGEIANPRAATNKTSNEMIKTALQPRSGGKSINVSVKLTNEVSTMTGTIEIPDTLFRKTLHDFFAIL